jgi:hypothetical protein
MNLHIIVKRGRKIVLVPGYFAGENTSMRLNPELGKKKGLPYFRKTLSMLPLLTVYVRYPFKPVSV